MNDDNATPAPTPDSAAPDRDIHVVETGENWEVWRKGESMPLGTFFTRSEADERAAAQAAEDGVRYVDHEAVLPGDGDIQV